MTSLPFYFFLVAACFCSCLQASWDVECWLLGRHTQWECGAFRLYGLGEVRANHDISQISYLRLTEGLACQLLPNLDVEAHYTLIYRKPRGGTSYGFINRIELEANPFLHLSSDWLLKWRNRLMFLSVPKTSKIISVFSHRVDLVRPLADSGPLVALRCFDELYFNITSNQMTQNRLIPLQLTLALAPSIVLDLLLMVRNFQSSGKWYRSVVFGSQVEF